MRRVIIISVLVGVGSLLVGCGPAATPVVPTVAQLPTVTDQPAPVPTEPAAEVFFTPTPMDASDLETESSSPDDADMTPVVEDGEAGPAVEMFTPTAMVEVEMGGDDGACSQAALDAALVGLDTEALSADLEAVVTQLRAAVATVDTWTLAEDGGLLGASPGDGLPLASLKYQRESGQEAFVLVSQVPGTLHEFFATCLQDDAYFREGDLSAEATVAVEPLGIGDQGTLATVVEPVDPEMSDMGLSEMQTEVYAVLVGDTLIQYVNIPALDEVLGLTPVTRSEAILLLSPIVSAARGE